MKTIFDFEAIDNNGISINFDRYKGNVLLIVNTASKCGFTPQYEGLESLYAEYKDRGLIVIGFPCNQFLHQEPGNDSDIQSFCKLNYGVSFPIMKKVEVNGKNAHPIFKYLRKQTGGFLGNRIKWNFTKFLVSKDGELIKRYSPMTKPSSLVDDIEKLLNDNY